MRKFTRYGLAASMAAALAWGLSGCGGGADGNQQLSTSYTSLVSFGDSLSDVGTYKVGGIVAMGGGKYTVNSASAKNWTELLAAQMGLPAPCAAQTGLNGDVNYGFNVPVVNTVACLNYAQGGARVTNPVGPGNKYLGGANATLGQLTVPVVTQITNHLSKTGGTFSGKELVTVMAGGNDVFINLASVSAGMNPTDAVTAMGTAGAELAGYIKTMILAKGATKVAVLNIPDVKGTPFGQSTNTATQGLIDLMVTTFNAQLKAGLQNTSGVLLIDAYTASKDETANPAQYGLTNVTGTACILDNPARNALASSLVCNASNVNAGDVSHYLFADTVHPTPYGYQLIAQEVTKDLVLAKWF